MVHILVRDMASSTGSSCVGKELAPFTAFARGEAKLVMFVSIFQGNQTMRWTDGGGW